VSHWGIADVQVYRDGESAPELTREPEKRNAGGKRTYYDSVQVHSVVYGGILCC